MTIQYNASIVRNGLVLHLDAANPKSYPGSGTTWTDLSGNGNNGAFTNSPTYLDAAKGQIAFDGVDDYITVQNSSSLNPANSTLICWARSNTELWNNNGFLMSKRDVFVMHPNANAKSVSYYYRLNNAWAAESVTPEDVVQWNMYAYSWDGSVLAAYLNGNFVRSGTKTGPLNTSDTGVMTIGRDDGTGRYMNGAVSSCMMYNRALSDLEIRQNFEALRGRYGI